MKTLIPWFLLGLLLALPAEAKPIQLYVAPDGHDAWNGMAAAHRGADGPFQTLERARDEIRTLKKMDQPPTGFTVFVRGGTYWLPSTLVLEKQDSGTPGAPVVYRAYGKEKPVIIGGKPITGFQPYRGKIMQAGVGAQGFKGVPFHQLFMNGQRQILARYPNYDPSNPYGGGWAYVAGKPIPMYQDVPGEDRHTLHFKPEDVHPWAHPEEAEVFIFPRYNWWNNVIQIASIQKDASAMTLAGDASYPIRPGDRYYVQNLLEELDSPGEWYLDQRTWTLYFWPPADLNGATVYAPTLQTLVKIGPGASNITLQGLTLECSDWDGVEIHDSSNCLFAGNTLRNVGSKAVWGESAVDVQDGSHNGIVGNDIYSVGGNAISLTGGDRATLTPAENYADNNYIHHTGVFFKQGVGVSIGGVGNRVSHNLIHDCPRFAIQFSGSDHIIEYNHARHLNLETADTGAIYSWQVDWTLRGTVIRYNFLHDVLGYSQENGRWISPAFAWGIYLDDGTCGTTVYGNIVARAANGGAHIHGGRDNLIENNIFIDGTSRQMSLNGYIPQEPHVKEMIDKLTGFKDNPAYAKYPGLRDLDIT
ncbi:MAG: right-handed parallel beta-helix repeat-containing protein, partial [Armatimonadota bacterium]|nr:right-handed parallel beta-helix repeat-containing protein [Armatimonadota bacterium]